MLNDFKRQAVELLTSLETGNHCPVASIPISIFSTTCASQMAWRDFASGWSLFPRALPRSIPFGSCKMATLFLPTRNPTSAVPGQASIFSDFKQGKTVEHWDNPPAGRRAEPDRSGHQVA